MRQLCLFATVATVCLLFVQPSGLIAADGAIPIWEPTTITDPGSYVVTRNIENLSPDTSLLKIESNNVYVDLNGFTLRNVGTENRAVISADDVHAVTITNGTIASGGDDAAVHFTGVIDFEISKTTVIDGFNDYGVLLTGCEVGVVEDNLIDGFESGIGVWGGGHIRILRNVLRLLDADFAMYLASDHNTVEGNTIDHAGGIEVTGSANRIVNNEISGFAYSGIAISGSRNRIEGNSLLGSGGGVGLHLTANSTDNLYRANFARGNNVDFQDAGTNNTSHGDNYMPGKM